MISASDARDLAFISMLLVLVVDTNSPSLNFSLVLCVNPPILLLKLVSDFRWTLPPGAAPNVGVPSTVPGRGAKPISGGKSNPGGHGCPVITQRALFDENSQQHERKEIRSTFLGTSTHAASILEGLC